MDWTTILVSLFGTLTTVEFINGIRFRKAQKRMKDNEAADSDTATQEKQINLAELYLQKVMSVTEGGWNKVEERLDKIDVRISYVEEYLNGEFKKFAAEKKGAGK